VLHVQLAEPQVETVLTGQVVQVVAPYLPEGHLQGSEADVVVLLPVEVVIPRAHVHLDDPEVDAEFRGQATQSSDEVNVFSVQIQLLPTPASEVFPEGH